MHANAPPGHEDVPPTSHSGLAAPMSHAALRTMALGALGVVYGDIGTSPLYALRECVHGAHALATTNANILSLLSLMFWSVTLVVSFKYLGFIMRADND